MFHPKLGRHFIRKWRKARRLKAASVAESLGTTETTIYRIEAGTEPYTQYSLEGLASILQVPAADLLGRDPEADPFAMEAAQKIEALDPYRRRILSEIIEILERVGAPAMPTGTDTPPIPPEHAAPRTRQRR